MTREFKKAVAEADEWKPVMKEVNGESKPTATEGAEVCCIPHEIAFTKSAPVLRYIATRELLRAA